MTKSTFLTMLLFALTLIAILLSSWIVMRRPQTINWVFAGLIAFGAVLLLIGIAGRDKEA